MRYDEIQQLRQIVQKIGLKKIYIKSFGTGQIVIPVPRAGGQVEDVYVTRRKALITDDPDILLKAANYTVLKIADPGAMEILRYYFLDKDLPKVGNTMNKKWIRIWKYKDETENLMREELRRNGYEVTRDESKRTEADYTIESMAAFLKNHGYKVIKTNQVFTDWKCPGCKTRMREVSEKMYNCHICNKNWVELRATTGKKILRIADEKGLEMLKEYLNETPNVPEDDTTEEVKADAPVNTPVENDNEPKDGDQVSTGPVEQTDPPKDNKLHYTKEQLSEMTNRDLKVIIDEQINVLRKEEDRIVLKGTPNKNTLVEAILSADEVSSYEESNAEVNDLVDALTQTEPIATQEEAISTQEEPIETQTEPIATVTEPIATTEIPEDDNKDDDPFA